MDKAERLVAIETIEMCEQCGRIIRRYAKDFKQPEVIQHMRERGLLQYDPIDKVDVYVDRGGLCSKCQSLADDS